MENTVVIYTDGACRGNPGPGGWGVSLRYNGQHKTLSGSDSDTTNNRMELLAAIMALEALKRSSQVRLHTDSKYVLEGITSWMVNWKKRGWKTSSGKPVKNLDLWKRLDSARDKHQIEWLWVKGHSGDEDNELVDSLANQAIDEMLGNT